VQLAIGKDIDSALGAFDGLRVLAVLSGTCLMICRLQSVCSSSLALERLLCRLLSVYSWYRTTVSDVCMCMCMYVCVCLSVFGCPPTGIVLASVHVEFEVFDLDQLGPISGFCQLCR